MATDETSRRQPERSIRVGPGLLVTAAFIGPGTVITASRAGTEYGCGLLWIILFATIGTIVLQSLAARLGIVEGKGLGESIRNFLTGSPWYLPAIILVLSALGIGNTAYQTGNLTGAVAGIRSLTGGSKIMWLAFLMIVSASILWIGKYRILHRVLVTLVVLLSLAFLVAGLVSLRSADEILRGVLAPQFDLDSLGLMIALIGTTIVPYNLFLHASGASATWSGQEKEFAARQSDWDTVISVSLGGLVTAAILLTANAAFYENEADWTSIDQVSQQLRPSLGDLSGFCFAIGLFAAGLTSALTAPIATAFAICGCLGWSTDPGTRRFRIIAISVVIVGGAIAILSGKSPVLTIQFAQVTNGLLLPIVACFLLIITLVHNRDRSIGLGSARMWLAVVVVAFVIALGCWRIFSVFV